MRALPRLLALLTLVGAASAHAATPAELHAQGLALWKKGALSPAREMLRDAVNGDDTLAAAHWDLAAVMIALRAADEPCESPLSEIVTHLERALALEPARRARLTKDKALAPFRETLAWQRLLGRDPARPADARLILEQVAWSSLSIGASGPGYLLDLQRGGTLQLKVHVLPDDGVFRWDTVPGTWTFKGGQVELTLRTPLDGHKVLKGHLEPSGELLLEAPVIHLGDNPRDCDA